MVVDKRFAGVGWSPGCQWPQSRGWSCFGVSLRVFRLVRLRRPCDRFPPLGGTAGVLLFGV
jgi:hypothetical protein